MRSSADDGSAYAGTGTGTGSVDGTLYLAAQARKRDDLYQDAQHGGPNKSIVSPALLIRNRCIHPFAKGLIPE